MKPKHSPGPWSVHGDNQTLIGDQSGKCMIAEVNHSHIVTRWSRPLPQAQANARLIAAAPDMLECIEDFCAAYAPDDGGEMSWEALNDVLQKALRIRDSVHNDPAPA